MDVSEHVFRQQSAHIVTALSRIFGLDRLALAEDVAQDVFCRALHVWKLRGVPQNPSAWLMKAAKNRAIDLLRRERTARNSLPELGRSAEHDWIIAAELDHAFSVETIEDDRLRMMFSCCHPSISEETQVALTLYLLCGFTTNEIASAFLSKRAAVEKRIERGKKLLGSCKELFDLADAELQTRLHAVHRVLYLLFNEGYHGASREAVVRTELCKEAMRLAAFAAETERVCTPETDALCALMWLNAARLPARIDAYGNLLSFKQQDRSRWDEALIARGNAYLNRSARGSELSEYHVEAAIASLHSSAGSEAETDWRRLLWLYDILMRIHPSPVVALNRAIALAQQNGPESGMEAIRAIPASEQLTSYPFYPAALGELELRAGHVDRAREHFEAAVAMARNPMERRFLEFRVEAAV